MKRILFSLSLILLLASCERQEPRTGWLMEPVRFGAEALSTRTLFSASGADISAVWEQDDTVAIWCSGSNRGNYPYTASVSKQDASKASFGMVSEDRMFYYDGNASTYYACYPYNPANGDTPQITFSLPSAQVQEAAGEVSHLKALQPFRAAPVEVSGENSQVNFSFTPVLCTVHLGFKMGGGSINVPVRRLRLISEDADLAAPEVSLDLSDASALPVAASGEKELTLAFSTLPELTADAEADAYLTVLPGAHPQGLSLELTAIDGSVASMALPAVTFRSGAGYSRSVSLALEDFVQAEPFDISASTLTATAGQPVEFTLQGSANGIDFWSGERLHDYAYAEVEHIETRPLRMSFKHAIAAGTQNNHPLVKVSSDFSGTMSEAEILSASWTDISDNFTFATENLGSDNPITTNIDTYNKYFVDSGEYDLTPHFASADAIYIAFFWHADKYDAALANTRTVSYMTRFRVGDAWEMSQDKLSLVWDADKWSGVASSQCPAWQTPKVASGVPDYPAFRFMSEFRPAEDRDAYAVTNEPFSLTADNLGFDTPFTVQAATEETPSSWSYTFSEPGTYDVVFTASCPTLSGDKTEIRKFTISVE